MSAVDRKTLNFLINADFPWALMLIRACLDKNPRFDRALIKKKIWD
jgi:hypothetical protein